jgi:hypothetical protein
LAPRAVIGDSWHRLINQGMDPDRARPEKLLEARELEHRRRETTLATVLPTLRASLTDIAEQASTIMVVADDEGRVLWRDGSREVRRRADRLGFIDGSCWAEDVVGTNAIGTALVVGRAMQVHSAEHFLRSHHPWTCSAAPVHDPRSGDVLGAVDLSGPLSTMHPHTLALATAVARLAEEQLRNAHYGELESLRSAGAPLLARTKGKALVTDKHGWVAACTGVAVGDRVLLPDQVRERSWLPRWGPCSFEHVPGGWLIRLDDPDLAVPTTVILDLSQRSRPRLQISGPTGRWQHRLSPRHAEILFVLASHPEGRRAAELAADLFGDPDRTVTIRAEMSRLRRHLSGLLEHRPYRFAEPSLVQLVLPEADSDVLPSSLAPEVRRLREAHVPR